MICVTVWLTDALKRVLKEKGKAVIAAANITAQSYQFNQEILK